EFQAPEAVRDIVELAASERVVVHLLEQPALVESAAPGRAVVRIGREIGGIADGAAVSVVAAPYSLRGAGTGAVAVIGPTRMDYARAVALVEHLAGLLGRE